MGRDETVSGRLCPARAGCGPAGAGRPDARGVAWGGVAHETVSCSGVIGINLGTEKSNQIYLFFHLSTKKEPLL